MESLTGDLALLRERYPTAESLNVELDRDGRTALHIAVMSGHAEVVAELLALGASPFLQSKLGDTPLHLAAYVNHEAAGKLLIAAARESLVHSSPTSWATQLLSWLASKNGGGLSARQVAVTRGVQGLVAVIDEEIVVVQRYMMREDEDGRMDEPVSCPACGAALVRAGLEVHRLDACPARAVRCPNCPILCPDSAALHAHLAETCPRVLLPCTYAGDGCKVPSYRNEMSEHVRTACEYAPVPCRLLCGEQLPRYRRPQHEAMECRLRSDNCPHGCGAFVYLPELAAHEAVCPDRLVACPRRCGCPPLPAKHMRVHCRPNPQELAAFTHSLLSNPQGSSDVLYHRSSDGSSWRSVDGVPVCARLPLPCPYNCGAEPCTVPVLLAHMQYTCAFRPAACSLGCGAAGLHEAARVGFVVLPRGRAMKYRGPAQLSSEELQQRVAADVKKQAAMQAADVELAALASPDEWEGLTSGGGSGGRRFEETKSRTVTEAAADEDEEVQQEQQADAEQMQSAAVDHADAPPAEVVRQYRYVPDGVGGHEGCHCPHRLIPCSLQCGVSLRACDDKAHCANQCPNRVVGCAAAVKAAVQATAHSHSSALAAAPVAPRVPAAAAQGSKAKRAYSSRADPLDEMLDGLTLPEEVLPCAATEFAGATAPLAPDAVSYSGVRVPGGPPPPPPPPQPSPEQLAACAAVLARDTALHAKEQCSFRRAVCSDRCGAQMPAFQLGWHLSHACPRRTVRCPLSCGETMVVTAVAQHCADRCRNREARCACGFITTVEALPAHVSSGLCSAETVSCPLGCEEQLTRAQLSAHIATDCVNRPVPCPAGCVAVHVTASTVQAHLDTECPLVLLPCEQGCGAEIARADLLSHMTDRCRRRVVMCPFGCGDGFPAEDMGDHVSHTGWQVACPAAPRMCPYNCGTLLLRLPRDDLVLRMTTQLIGNKAVRVGTAGTAASGDFHTPMLNDVSGFFPSASAAGLGVAVEMDDGPRDLDAYPPWMHQHLAQDCTHKMVICPRRCRMEVRQVDLPHHIAHECARRMIACPHGCGERFAAFLLPRHVDRCNRQKLCCSMGAITCQRELRAWLAGPVHQGNGYPLLCEAHNDSALHGAVKEKKLPTVDVLLNLTGNKDVDMEDSQGCTPLVLAARARDLPMMQLLLDHGADPNKETSRASTPLLAAIRGMEDVERMEERVAMKVGGIKAVATDDYTLRHATSCAARFRSVQLLLSRGALPYLPVLGSLTPAQEIDRFQDAETADLVSIYAAPLSNTPAIMQSIGMNDRSDMVTQLAVMLLDSPASTSWIKRRAAGADKKRGGTAGTPSRSPTRAGTAGTAAFPASPGSPPGSPPATAASSRSLTRSTSTAGGSRDPLRHLLPKDKYEILDGCKLESRYFQLKLSVEDASVGALAELSQVAAWAAHQWQSDAEAGLPSKRMRQVPDDVGGRFLSLFKQRTNLHRQLVASRARLMLVRLLHSPVGANRHTLLSYAAAYLDNTDGAKLVDILLQCGASVNVTDDVAQACGRMILQLCRFAVERRKGYPTRDEGLTPGADLLMITPTIAWKLMLAVQAKRLQHLRRLSRVPLHEALYGGKSHLVEHLLSRGAQAWIPTYILPMRPPPHAEYGMPKPVLLPGPDGKLKVLDGYVRVPQLVANEDTGAFALRWGSAADAAAAAAEAQRREQAALDAGRGTKWYVDSVTGELKQFEAEDVDLLAAAALTQEAPVPISELRHCLPLPKRMHALETAALGFQRYACPDSRAKNDTGAQIAAAEVAEPYTACIISLHIELQSHVGPRVGLLADKASLRASRALQQAVAERDTGFTHALVDQDFHAVVAYLIQGSSAHEAAPGVGGHTPLSAAAACRTTYLNAAGQQVPAAWLLLNPPAGVSTPILDAEVLLLDGLRGAQPYEGGGLAVPAHQRGPLPVEPVTLAATGQSTGDGPLALTPLCVAALNRNTVTMELLLEHGADPCRVTHHPAGLRRTPLHYAAMGGSLDAVRMLINRGAEHHVRDALGKTVADYAGLYKHFPILNDLLSPEEGLAGAGGHGGRPPSTTELIWLCPLGCGARMLSSIIPDHVANDCPAAPVPCPLGCGSSSCIRSGLQQHLATECAHRPARCPNGCTVVLRGSELEHHVQQECPSRRIACELGCPRRMVARDAPQHYQLYCSHRSVPCDQCGEHMRACDVTEHKKEVCPETLMPCPHKCGGRIARHQLHEHATAVCARRPLTCTRDCGITVAAEELQRHLNGPCPLRPVTCPNGCKAVPLRDVSSHAPVCPLRLIACTVPRCKGKYHAQDEERHLASTCKGRTVSCTYGCGATMIERDREQHEVRECELRPVPCGFGCGMHLPLTDMPAHKADACVRRPVKCVREKCSKMVPLADMEVHLSSQCRWRPIPCPSGCGAVILAASTQSHLNTACPMKRVACRVCGQEVPVDELEEHEMISCPNLLPKHR